MWTRHSRVIWLCLTKQHSQTQKFLLGLFSHHSSEAGAGRGRGGRGDGQGDRIREREIRGGERGNISLAWGKIQLPERHTTLRLKKKKKQFMDGEKEAEISWSEKFMISSEMSSAWSSVVSRGPEVPWPDWLSAWDWGAWLAVAHSTV